MCIHVPDDLDNYSSSYETEGWDTPVSYYDDLKKYSPIPINPNAYDIPTTTSMGYQIRDSGQRQEFSTGSRRDLADGKGRYDLISPVALRRLALHYEKGAKKYGDRNWEKGQPLSRYLDSALRHINNFRDGDKVEDHLIAAVWNLMAFVHTEEKIGLGELPGELNDLE